MQIVRFDLLNQKLKKINKENKTKQISIFR